MGNRLTSFSLLIIIFTFFSCSQSSQKSLSPSTGASGIDKVYADTIKLALSTSQVMPDKSFKLLNSSLKHSIQKNDTTSMLKCLIGITDIERYRGNYNIAFEKLWEALLLANEQGNRKMVIVIHRNLGILYNIYHKKEKAIYHIKMSQDEVKKIDPSKSFVKGQMKSNYFSLATVYKDSKEYHLALTYLDSCIMLTPDENLPYVEADKGYIYLKTGRLNEAETALNRAKEELLKKNSHYLIAVYSFLGDLKSIQQQTDSAIYFYQKSLKEADSRNAHLEFKPDVLRKLSTLYLNKKKNKRAYKYLQASINISDSLFNAKSERNLQLFEIKNQYKEALNKQQKLVKNQDTLIREQAETKVQLMILSAILLIISVGGFLLHRLQTKLKKLHLKQALEKDKSKAVLDVKSKELTTYALQMIEKEQALHELLDTIKEISPQKYKTLQHKYMKQSNSLWDEFNMRFVEVNSGFYTKLREKHPDITPTELKHCALIKLNFDSPEMAKILNISTQSVHTSRYRIRKKFNLEHDESLGNYIAMF